MKQFIEVHNRVFSVEWIKRGGKRSLKVEVESGEDLDGEEYYRLSAALVAELISLGYDVTGWDGW